MNYKNNKLSLNKISQDFHFKVKFGLVLIYILKVYCKKSSSILLRKNIFNSFFFSFEKHVPSQISKDFSNENIETAPSTFLKKIWSEIYLSWIINYWVSIFILSLTWGAFSLVCVPSVLVLCFFLLFFLFLPVYSFT